MGRASSSKKVARAAGTGGGRTNRGRTPWTFYSVIAVIAVLGVVFTWSSRDRRITQINTVGGTPPTVGGTPWNEGYAIDICGKISPPIQAPKVDVTGITTNGDGVIAIHPYVKSAAGHNATLGKFASSVGMTLNAATIKEPGGKAYTDGDDCNGQPGHIYVKQFAYAKDTVGKVLTQNPDDVLLADQQMVTIAFVPKSDQSKIPPPGTTVQNNLTNAAASTSSTTASGSTSTTKAGSTTSTTKAGSTSSTTAGSPAPAAGTTTTTKASSTTSTTK
jgi:hypothetical protein